MAWLQPDHVFAQALQALVQLFSKPCTVPAVKQPIPMGRQQLLDSVTWQWSGWSPHNGAGVPV